MLLEGQLRKAEQVIGTVGYLSVLVVLDEARFRLLVDEVALLPSNTEAVSTLGVTPYALDLMIHNRDAIPLTCAIEDKGPGLVKISIEKSEIVEPDAKPANQQSNRRNGTSRKTLKGNDGALPIDVPRDRDGSFEPELIKKGQTRIDGMDDKIIGLYAAGLSTRDIRAHLEEVYGLKVSADLISRVTDAVLEEVSDWQNRALEPMYPIVFLDALRVKIRDAESRQVKNKAVYVALGVTPEGEREVLGLWIAANEGAKFWLSVMNNLRNRGVEDILIAVVDGLKGFPDAINAAFPEATVQTCIVHLVRHSLNFCGWKDRKTVANDLKRIYQATDDVEAEKALADFEAEWGQKYPSIAPSWRRAWQEVIPFFAFPPAVRKIIYTTNAIESLNRVIRKTTKTRFGQFRAKHPFHQADLELLHQALIAQQIFGVLNAVKQFV